jgi:hypothetical protein
MTHRIAALKFWVTILSLLVSLNLIYDDLLSWVYSVGIDCNVSPTMVRKEKKVDEIILEKSHNA